MTSRRTSTTLEQFHADEAAFYKLASKYALRIVDHCKRWEQSACKLADETKDIVMWRRVENLKSKVEDFANKATDIAK